MICHLCIAQNIDTALGISSQDVKDLHHPVNPFFAPTFNNFCAYFRGLRQVSP